MTVAIGSYESALRIRAIEVRRRLMGAPPVQARPIPRALLAPPPATVSQPVFLPVRVATTNARKLVTQVALAHGLTWRDLLGPCRERRVVLPRNEAAFRLITELRLSYPKAARVLRRDHTTVLHSCRRHAETSPEAAEIWRRHVECETADRAHKHVEALRMHFEEGLGIGKIAAKLHVMPVTVKRWIANAAVE